MAKWGIGGQDFWLQDGKVWSADRRCFIVDAQTAVGVDLPRKLLFLAVGTHISPRLMFQTLADLGARDGMLLDGGVRPCEPATPRHANGIFRENLRQRLRELMINCRDGAAAHVIYSVVGQQTEDHWATMSVPS